MNGRFIIILCVLCIVVLLVTVAAGAGLQKEIEPEPSELTPSPSPAPADGAWMSMQMTQQEISEGLLILVNNETPYSPEGVSDLVQVYERKNDCYYVKDNLLQVRQEIIPYLNDWCEAAFRATGADNANVVAGYRTREYQQKLYDNAALANGADYAEQYIAHAGYSEHHTGLAIDFSLYLPGTGLSEEFDSNRELSGWMLENAWKYGFIQRYPEGKQAVTGIAYESWHFRYVGKPHAWYMWENNLCLEEYLQMLRGFSPDEPLSFSCDGQAYEVYFCKSLSCTVPTDAEYTVSGNNTDGFIVTVER